MAKPIIEIDGIGKCYRIGAAREKYLSLRDELSKWFSRAAWRDRATGEQFWALRDVSFSVQAGEAVGIIGRNGAGKSTLLKILSQITPPTEGKITMRGRVGSLLEVGTGFHPELTGRENIYMNGAILGMSRREIASKFDEIVAFAEMERFLETPVKRYSSGMYVRLAFAVAAHLEPEILVVDEVLAVGDAEFQKKCLGKMGEVATGGRTVLFVSHNMATIRTLCARGLVLSAGRVQYAGDVLGAVDNYLNGLADTTQSGVCLLKADASLPLVVSEMRTIDAAGETKKVFSRSSPITIQVRGRVNDSKRPLIVAIDFRNRDGLHLFRTHSFEQESAYQILGSNGEFLLQCTVPKNFLPAGRYSVGLDTSSVVRGDYRLQNEPEALELEVVQEELFGGYFAGTRGLVTPLCEWKRL